MSYQVGIIGCGVIGQRLARFFSIHESTIIKTVCDVDQDLAKSLATEYNADFVLNYEEILKDGEIDIVYIGIPPSAHYQVIMDCFKTQKHILSEKPLTLNFDLCLELIQEKNNHNNLLTAVNFPFRFNSGVEKLKQEIKSIGLLKNIEFSLRYPKWPRAWQDVKWLKSREQGGPFREVGTHFFFLLNELFGSVQSVNCQVEFPDNDHCETGATGYIQVNNSLRCDVKLVIGESDKDINDIVFNGTKGTLAFREWGDLFFIDNKGSETQYEYEYQYSLLDLLKEFTRVLDQGVSDFTKVKNRLVSFEDASQAQRILDAIYNSNGEEIKF